MHTDARFLDVVATTRQILREAAEAAVNRTPAAEDDTCAACGASTADPEHDCGGCETCGALNRGYGAEGGQCATCAADDEDESVTP